MVAGAFHFVEQVARHDDGTARRPAQVANCLPHLHHTLRVQAVDGFIQYQQLRVVDQGRGDAQALFHAGGALGELARCRRSGQTDLSQQPLHFLRVLTAGVDALNAAQIVPAGKVGPHQGSGNQRAGASQGQRVFAFSQQVEGPLGGGDESGEDAEQGGLAGTIGPQQAEDGPGGHDEIHSAQGGKASKSPG